MSSNRAIAKAMGSIRETIVSLRVLLTATLLAVLAGCSPSAEEEPDSATNPLLYEIASANGEVEGWMLGTIHLLPDGVAWRTGQIDAIIDDADLLVVEIADLEDRAAISRLFVELGTTHGLPDISQRVAPSQRAALLSLIERTGLSPGDFSAIETWAAALMLAQGNAIGKAENGVDCAVLKDFSGREIRELEGAASQLTIFDRLAEEDQRVLLAETVSDPELAKEEAQALLDAWLTGDVAAIETLTTTGAMADREVRNALLVDRNALWIDRLVPILRSADKPLVAVGAAHLVGKDGLPAMLNERGYTVRRLYALPK